MHIIDGKKIADEICHSIKNNIISAKTNPTLVVVMVGNRKDSLVYVNAKKRRCEDVGINFILKEFDENSSTLEVEREVTNLSMDSSVHAILVQLPLPDHMDTDKILKAISPSKDVDGFHPENIGHLANGNICTSPPCTPKGIMRLLKHVDLEGKRVAIIGASKVVGLPLFHLLLHARATVTLCHVYTKDIKSITREADILISCCGQAEMIKKDWMNPNGNAIVIDVGINHIPDETKKSGYRLTGDVDFENVKEHVSTITPVPGGVGPMTVAMLVENVWNLYNS